MNTTYKDEGWRVGLDSSGNVFAGGFSSSCAGTSCTNVLVTKLNGKTGSTIWGAPCVLPANPSTTPSVLYGLAVDISGGAGNVSASGATNNHTKLLAFKCNGSTGGLIWSNNSLVSTVADQQAFNAAVDSSNNVIAGGWVKNSQYDFAVAKFQSASPGSLLWTGLTNSYYAVHGSGTSGCGVTVSPWPATARDGQDNIIAGGTLNGSGTARDSYVVKLNASNGSVLWSYFFSNSAGCPYANLSGWDEAQAIAVEMSTGNVIVGGYMTTGGLSHFTVAKLSSGVLACGRPTEIWRKTPLAALGGGSSISGAETATAVALDSNGDVLAIGQTLDSGLQYHTAAVKLSGSNGNTLWTYQADPNGVGNPKLYPTAALVVDSRGNAVFGGYQDSGTPSGNEDFAVVKLRGSSGGVVAGYPYFLNESGATGAKAYAVAVNSVNDVVAVGDVDKPSTDEDFVAVSIGACSGSDTINCGNGIREAGEHCDGTSKCTAWCRTTCAGDCNADGQVTVGEVTIANQIAQGSQPLSNCYAADITNDCAVTVDELTQINNNALHGCP